MIMKINKVVLGCMAVALTMHASAASLEVVPTVGYAFNGNLDLAGPVNDRLVFNHNPLTGLSIGYVDNGGELELSWLHSNTMAEIDHAGGAPSDHLDLKTDQLHINGIFLTDTSGAVQPFGLFGLGATRFSPSGDRTSEIHFSFALGAGVKWFWNDFIGLRADAQWDPVLVLPGSHFFCDEKGTEGCYSTQDNSLLSHAFPLLSTVEFTTGLILKY
jgi:opacity protein-like surface antigen